MDVCFRCKHNGDEHPVKVASLMKQLKSQRLIKIFVGDAPEPYLMAEATLTDASDYFTKALKHEASLGGRESGILRFPEDGDFKAAWEILLFWLAKKCLPPEYTWQDGDEVDYGSSESLIRTWVLADKYFLPELQDAVMLEMLGHFTDTFLLGILDEPAFASTMLRISPVNSPLRKLVAEEVVRAIYDPRGPGYPDFTAEQVNSGDEALGVAASLLDACHEFTKSGYMYLRSNILESMTERSEAWEQYLIGGFPEKHWVWNHLFGE